MHVVFGPEIFGQRHGGISRYFIELHTRLREHNVSSTIFAGLYENAYLDGIPRVRGLRLATGFPREHLRTARQASNNALASAYLRTHDSNILYHQTYYRGTVGLKHTGPTVVTAYDAIHAIFPEQFPAGDRTVEWQRTAFANADLILAISKRTKQDLSDRFGISSDRIVVTYLGVLPPNDTSTPRLLKRPPFLLYVGLRFGYKNWERFVRGFSESSVSRHLEVLCVGGGRFTKKESELLERLGIRARVHQREADDAQLDSLYRSAVAFVYPSLYEGFGLPPLEAMARGCPVLSSQSGAIPEILGEAALLVDPTHIETISNGIETIMDPVRRAGLKDAGLRRVKLYSWDETARKTALAYSELQGC